MVNPVWRLLPGFSWQELRHHLWRNAAAVLAVTLGVALALSVHLINGSALEEFAQATRSVNGQADLELRARSGPATMDEVMLARMLQHPDVAQASAVLEINTYALAEAGSSKRFLLRVIGIDALQIAGMTPDLLPTVADAQDRFDLFAPDAVFLNAGASKLFPGKLLQAQLGMSVFTLRVAGSVRSSGAALAVMDIAAAQDLFDRAGQISRVDVRLRAGLDPRKFMDSVQSAADWPSRLYLSEPAQAQNRINNLSRAYRVNLTVLALVALFTGGFLVYSVLALSVSRRSQQFALLGVLGLTGAQRLQLVLCEAGLLGLLGSLMGVALGSALAGLALHWLDGDLGGGYFPGITLALHWNPAAAAGFGGLGVLAALLGAWWPARLAQQLPPAQTLKGLGSNGKSGTGGAVGAALLATGLVLALLPPLGGIPVAAYFSVALLLLGGVGALPTMVGAILKRVAPLVQRQALPLLAIERSRRVRESATVAVSGVVASLSLAVALTVMVASFRHSVTDWLDTLLPASLYVRSASNSGTSDSAFLDPAFVEAVKRVEGVTRLDTQRSVALTFDPDRPAVALLARRIDPAAPALPLVGPVLPVPPGMLGIYVSEAMVDLYGARPGQVFTPLKGALAPLLNKGLTRPDFFVAGVWRDYARQFGTIAIDQTDFATISSDARVNDLSIWLAPDATTQQVQEKVESLANRMSDTPQGQAGHLLEFSSASEIRALTLKIFDRSFAVTYWLQAVAIAIGLFGVAASFSAQVLARRKEFGLLVHLGLTRSQILRLVAMEGAAWTILGAIAGIALGLAVAVVLVKVVNPQSFHWSMDLTVPIVRLLALGGAVVLAGTVTAFVSGQAAASRDAVLAVKEDW
jgi:putative ABC transport system permease protein